MNKSTRLNLPLIDASVARAVQPVVVPERGIADVGSAAEVGGAAVAGNKSRYLKGNVTSLAEKLEYHKVSEDRIINSQVKHNRLVVHISFFN